MKTTMRKPLKPGQYRPNDPCPNCPDILSVLAHVVEGPRGPEHYFCMPARVER